ncbi:hypothetical protein HPB47_019194 [Ixodes persulcatus]|uniref:Uncharacterized protein n=1 Tax=Ixodes persulcatus TaxID=34615 RepID=A0AC60QMF5_IXOPE|nr:hypothetical protein HPB47_019194 [Ixodes persulcatus]
MCFPLRCKTVDQVKSREDAGWSFAPGDPVYIRNYRSGEKWTPGKVKETAGSRVVKVETDNGVVHRHMDQLRRRSTDAPIAASTPPAGPGMPVDHSDAELERTQAPTASDIKGPLLRRSTRVRRPVVRYGFQEKGDAANC